MNCNECMTCAKVGSAWCRVCEYGKVNKNKVEYRSYDRCLNCARRGSFRCNECLNYSNYLKKSPAVTYDVKNGYGIAIKKEWTIDKDFVLRVIFNDPATIVFWADGTKTVVKCQEGDVFDPEKGLAMAISKKMFGNRGNYCDIFKKWVDPYWDQVYAVPTEISSLRMREIGAALNESIEDAIATIKRLTEAGLIE